MSFSMLNSMHTFRVHIDQANTPLGTRLLCKLWMPVTFDLDPVEMHSRSFCTTVLECWSHAEAKWQNERVSDVNVHCVSLCKQNRPISTFSKLFKKSVTAATKCFWMVLEGYSKSRKILHRNTNWDSVLTFKAHRMRNKKFPRIEVRTRVFVTHAQTLRHSQKLCL